MELINNKYQFSLYSNLYEVEKPTQLLTINDLIEIVKYGYLKESITQIRNTKDKKKRSKLKQKLPAVTLSGQFGYRSSKGFKKHSGLMQIDIDEVENYDQRYQSLIANQFTYVAFRSPSGNGIKVIVKISASKDTHLGQFNALQEYYLEQYKIDIDEACHDLSRCMLLSWDPDLFCNPHSEVFDGFTMPEERKIQQHKRSLPNLKDEYALDEEKVVAYISRELALRKIDITTPFQNWIQIGFSIAYTLGETGRQYFHEISSVYPEYKPNELDKVYSGILKKNDGRITIGTLIYHAKENGINLSELYEDKKIVSSKSISSKVELYDIIKEWRYKKSKEIGKPAFTVFSNKVLDQLVKLKPSNEKQLLKINGLGKMKMEQYGEELITLIKQLNTYF